MYIVSACIVGINCRYNGTSSHNLDLQKMIDEGLAIAVCPELLVGLPIPRESCEIQVKLGKRIVVGESGSDYTKLFEKAAVETLKICKTKNIRKAILQERSPSCGYGKVYDGTFEGGMIKANGLTADLLSKNGVEVFNDKNWKAE